MDVGDQNYLFFLLAKIRFIKVVISPHGMIDPLSFAQKKLKKFGMVFISKFIFFIFKSNNSKF